MTGLNTPSARKERPAIDALGDMSGADAKAFEAMANETSAPVPEPAPAPEPQPEPVAPPEPVAEPEPAAEPSAEPAEKPAAQAAPAENGKPPKGMVPVEALQETRAELKEVKAEYKRITDALMAKLTPVAEAPKADEPQIIEVPNEKEDPIGALAAMRHNFAVLSGQLQKQNERATTQDQRGAQVAQVQQIWNRAQGDENTFRAKTPDYMDASNFLVNSRREELGELIADNPNKQQQIEHQIGIERFNIAQRAAQENRNAAEIVYNLAIKRGYKVKTTVAVIPPPSDAAKVNGVDAAQKANRSLGQVNGSAGNKAPLPQRLAAMSDADFAAATSKMSMAELKAALGN